MQPGMENQASLGVEAPPRSSPGRLECSILTPFLFSFISSAFSEVDAQENSTQNIENHTVTNRTMLAEDGGFTYFADDSTYTATAQSEQELSEMLSEKFQVMAEYLTENRVNTGDTLTPIQ